jgi:hypothetical protein
MTQPYNRSFRGYGSAISAGGHDTIGSALYGFKLRAAQLDKTSMGNLRTCVNLHNVASRDIRRTEPDYALRCKLVTTPASQCTVVASPGRRRSAIAAVRALLR